MPRTSIHAMPLALPLLFSSVILIRNGVFPNVCETARCAKH